MGTADGPADGILLGDTHGAADDAVDSAADGTALGAPDGAADGTDPCYHVTMLPCYKYATGPFSRRRARIVRFQLLCNTRAELG